ncbi:hypothetical protein [Achromobacter aegrifaciens]|uniref:hypothetical protein n=1 Tax=Achromobacter aegrifaciens TaxID=1287736 RepID=UPI0012E2898F|nr:hypothetical protein [Achromobacter aegrifaciens]
MKPTTAKAKATLAALVLTFLSSCSINIVSNYDEALDKGAMDLVSMTASIFGKLRQCAIKGKGVCADPSTTYAPENYSEIRNKLDVMIVRSTADARNKGTTTQLYRAGQALLLDPPLPLEDSATAEAQGEREFTQPFSPLNSLEGRNSRNTPLDLQTIQLAQQLINIHFRAIMTTQSARKAGEKAELK